MPPDHIEDGSGTEGEQTNACAAYPSNGCSCALEFVEPAVAARLVEAERGQFFDRLGRAELLARLGGRDSDRPIEDLRASYLSKYTSNLVALDDQEKELVASVVCESCSILCEDYGFLAAEPWRVAKLEGNVEWGAPHTLGRLIVLTERFLRVVTSAPKDVTKTGQRRAGAANFLFHERLHVEQRSCPTEFESLYSDVWHFRKATVRLPSALEAITVTNPDGSKGSWIWQSPSTAGGESSDTWYLPLLVLSERALSGRRGISADVATEQIVVEVEATAVENEFSVRMDESGRPMRRSIREARDYRDFFPTYTLYDTNEIIAELFGRYAAKRVAVMLGDSETGPYAKAKIPEDVESWFHSRLGSSNWCDGRSMSEPGLSEH